MSTLDDIRIATKSGRWYATPTGKAVPSVTNILNVVNKGRGFEMWLGNARSYEDAMAERDEAGARGTAVHEIIAHALETGTLTRPEECDEKVWKLCLGFARWWQEWQPTLIASEVFVYTDAYAGTCDLIAEKDGNVWVIDIKTGAGVYATAHYQTAAYANAWQEMDIPLDKPDFIKHTAILHLKTSTKKGWQLVESPQGWENDYECFEAARVLWHAEHGYKPVLKEETETIGEVLLWA